MGQIVAIVGAAAVVALAFAPAIHGAGPGSPEARGYRLRGYQWDAVLGQRWAVYEDASHPERPLVSELVPEGGAETGGGAGPVAALVQPPPVQPVKGSELVVHSGDAVTLWRNEGNVRMQLAAVSEGSGGVGERVQLRVTGAGIFGNAGWRAVGVVRGPGSVEME
jgi:hypothetical protein